MLIRGGVPSSLAILMGVVWMSTRRGEEMKMLSNFGAVVG